MIEYKTLWENVKCWLPAFSPFPTVFSKALFFKVVKSRDCVGKGERPPAVRDQFIISLGWSLNTSFTVHEKKNCLGRTTCILLGNYSFFFFPKKN